MRELGVLAQRSTLTVVKPMSFVALGRRGVLQPAVKCRGREYLRIIYGPEYTRPENLDRLRARGLNAKRSLALRAFALGKEGSNDLCDGSRCGACTSVRLGYWRSRASRSTRVFERAAASAYTIVGTNVTSIFLRLDILAR